MPSTTLPGSSTGCQAPLFQANAHPAIPTAMTARILRMFLDQEFSSSVEASQSLVKVLGCGGWPTEERRRRDPGRPDEALEAVRFALDVERASWPVSE